jgi:hypothetical protein
MLHHLLSSGFFFFLSALAILGQSPAQTPPTAIKLIGKSKGNQVWLRYAPTTPVLWQIANQNGYQLERFLMKPDGSLEGPVRLTEQPIKPLTKAEFDQQSDPHSGMVGEIIYNEEFMKGVNADDPVQILKQYKEMENRFGLALFVCDISAPAAQAAGLMAIDKKVSIGQRYAYRIKIAGTLPTGISYEPGTIVVDVEAEKPLIAPEDLRFEAGDQQVTLGWPIFTHIGVYTAYIIEKSIDGKQFKPVSDLPFTNLTKEDNPDYAYFIDSLANNNTLFYYRIKGLTPFGEVSPSSKVVTVKGKDDMTGALVIDTALAKNNRQITISWRFPKEFSSSIKGFVVSRASKHDGAYLDLNTKPISPSVNQFTDTPSGYNHYYVVRALDKQGQEATRSFPYLAQLEDNQPPQVPKGLEGQIDDKGLAKLNWKNVPDADLLGYRVFKANHLREEFVEVTTSILGKPTFTDSVNLNTLTKEVYYKVIAVDKNFNTSDYTPPLKLMRPDKIPPAPAIFTKAKMNLEKEEINLEWENSPSTDVARMRLMRKSKKDTNQFLLKEWKATQIPSAYTDNAGLLGQTYTYLLEVSDSTGNTSHNISPSVFFETGVRKAVGNLSGVADREKRKIRLSWQYEALEVVKTIIYRASGNYPMRILETLEGNPGQYEDKDITLNTTYIYKIKLFFKNGIQTQLSTGIRVAY